MVLGVFLILGLTALTIDRQSNVSEKVIYDCDNLDVVYLKPSEKSLSGEVARKINGIAIVPEENYLVADTALLLQCDNINFAEYLDLGDMIL